MGEDGEISLVRFGARTRRTRPPTSAGICLAEACKSQTEQILRVLVRFYCCVRFRRIRGCAFHVRFCPWENLCVFTCVDRPNRAR